MSSITCLCADPLVSVINEPCSATKYGNQIVKIFAQKMDGNTFDGTAGNTVTVEADWDARLTAVNDDKIVTISNISGAVRPSSAPTLEEGNEVPYGGVEVIDRPQSITFSLKYFSQATFAQLDKIVCWGMVRFWFLDNNDYLWFADITTGDGISNATIITTTLSQAGIGTKNKAENNEIRWNSLCQPVPSATTLPFLKTK